MFQIYEADINLLSDMKKKRSFRFGKMVFKTDNSLSWSTGPGTYLLFPISIGRNLYESEEC